MGWAKYSEDIREAIDERNEMRREYFSGIRNCASYEKNASNNEPYSSYMKETRIAKRQRHRRVENVM
ncbi:MAG: hypothetical protein ACI4FW_03345 [Bariatricus sp.]